MQKKSRTLVQPLLGVKLTEENRDREREKKNLAKLDSDMIKFKTCCSHISCETQLSANWKFYITLYHRNYECIVTENTF